MRKFLFRIIANLSIFVSIWPLVANAGISDGYTCVLEMQTKMATHQIMSCRVALAQEKDMMLFMIGQSYIISGRTNDAISLFNEHSNKGYTKGAKLGKWAIKKFVLGNKPDEEINFKLETDLLPILRQAASRGDPLAHFINNGAKNNNLSNIKIMADQGNPYAAVYLFLKGKEELQEKVSYAFLDNVDKFPLGKVVQSYVFAKGYVDDEVMETQKFDEKKANLFVVDSIKSGSTCGYFVEYLLKSKNDGKTKLDINKVKNCWFFDGRKL